MTMTGSNSVMKDEVHPEHLVDETLSPMGEGPIELAFQAIKNLILPVHEELIRQIRVPTPQKVTKTFQVDAAGTLAGGITTNAPLTVYTCPVSSEAWLHRVSVSSPGHGPSAPLTAGEIVFLGSNSGENIYFTPVNGIVAPVIFTEGRASAPHLNSGETLGIAGDGLLVGAVIRVDLQILLIAPGTSVFTPNDRTPAIPLGHRKGVFE